MMITLYCQKKHGSKELCSQCNELYGYSNKKLELCQWGEDKPFCRYCPTPCYRLDMKQKIREVMRFAGPRMIIYHPSAAIKHAFASLMQSAKKRRS